MLKEKRKEMDYTQEQMSKMLDISLRQYVRIDNEEDLPRRDVLKKIVTIFKFTDVELGRYIRNMIEK